MSGEADINIGRRLAFLIDEQARLCETRQSLNGSESGGGHFPARFFASSGPANCRIKVAGKKKGRTMNPITQFKNATILIALTLASFVISPTARAVDPPPDGGYPNGNTAEGEDALFSLNTSLGAFNTAIGFNALYSNTTGSSNTAIGPYALYSNTIGGDNTAIGVRALSSNATGVVNVAVGSQALSRNTEGTENTAIGYGAMEDSTTGDLNIAIGPGALQQTTPGNQNIAIGWNAGSNLKRDFNIIIGNEAGRARDHKTIRIGRNQTATFIAGISQTPLASGTAVIIKPDGQLGITASSARFKEAIKPMDKASEAILALKPVTFRYKNDLDPDGIPQFGLAAEDVEKVNPDLVAHDDQGKPFTVRYEAVNAMLLNEFLKEHRKVEQLEKQIKAITAGLQKVSAQLEMSKAAPQTVLNDR
jgi:Chaperone of endosialidase